MKDGWYARLIAAIDSDGRDYKTLSRDAGLGRNYVQQMVKYGKEPGTGAFVQLLEALGTHASIKIILGIEMNPQDTEVLQILSGLNRPQRDAFRTLLQSLADEETREP